MNKRSLILVGIVIVAALAVGGFMFMGKNPSTPATQTTDTQPSVSTTTEAPSKMSLKSLMGQNVTCTYNDSENASSGTMYVSGENVSSEIKNQQNGKEILTHMVKNGNDVYIWNNAEKTGTKMTITKEDIEAGKDLAQGNNSFDIDREVDTDCTPWSPDNSIFTPPADVKFTDMTKMLEQVKSSLPKMDASVCDQIADANAKAQCIKALGN